MPPHARTRSSERRDTLTFLNVLKDFYPRIVDSDDKLSVWEEVLEECQNQHIFFDKTADYLAQKRWPASIGIVNKFSKKRGELSEKDQLIIEIERYRTPDFCFGKLPGDKESRENLTAKSNNVITSARQAQNNTGDDEVLSSDALLDSSRHDQTFASSNGELNNENQSDVVKDSSDDPASPSRLIAASAEEAPQARGTGNNNSSSQPMSAEPASINEIINEPNGNLQKEYFEAAIRAFKAYSELAEMKLQMMRHQKSPSVDN